MQGLKERFWAKVKGRGGDGCWLWTGVQNGYGYGRIKVKGRQVGAHRLSYEVHRGKIPAGLQIDHLCRIKNCVRPSHLEVVTPRENVRRGIRGILGGRKECEPGHEVAADGHCKTCRREQSRDRMRRYMRQYRLDHPEQMRETRARYEAKRRRFR